MVKILKVLNDVRSVWVVLGLLVTAAAFAGDLRWMTYTKHDALEIKEIRRAISMLEVDKSYARTPDEKEKYTSKIKIAENQIKEIKGE